MPVEMADIYNWRAPFPDNTQYNLLDGERFIARRQEEINARHENVVTANNTKFAGLTSQISTQSQLIEFVGSQLYTQMLAAINSARDAIIANSNANRDIILAAIEDLQEPNSGA